METRSNGTLLKILVAVTFVVMVATNALANALPINGITTGEVSDAHPDLFAPAGITFAIWGLIYLLLAGYTLYHLGLFREADGQGADPALLQRVGALFAVSSLANTAWIFAWHYDQIPLSLLLMLVILACLIGINRAIEGARREGRLNGRDRLFVRLPFSVYFGWITVATIANVTTLLVYLGRRGGGVPEPAWTSLVIIVGGIIGAVTTIRNRDVAYGLVIVWAFAGILLRHLSAGGEVSPGFDGQYVAVIATTIGWLVAMLGAVIYAALPERRAGPAPAAERRL